MAKLEVIYRTSALETSIIFKGKMNVHFSCSQNVHFQPKSLKK